MSARVRGILLRHRPQNVTENPGFLVAAVPAELGGLGLTHLQISARVRELANQPPGDLTVLKPHLCWTGVAADLWRAGDHSLEWVLRDAVRGAVFTAALNLDLRRPAVEARQVRGGYEFSPIPRLTPPLPAWTYVSVHGLDDDAPVPPNTIHAFMPRDTYESGFVPHRYIARVVPAAQAQSDLFTVTALTWLSSIL